VDEKTAINKADFLLRKAGVKPTWAGLPDLVRNTDTVRAYVSGLTPSERAKLPWLREWAESYSALYDKADKVIAADPMVLYRPQHKIAEDFHKSTAFVRYFMGGNRSSKTQSGYAEHYFVTTGQHKWRKFPVRTPNAPMTTFLVGLAYSKYAPTVFEKKFLTGEQGNYLSPMFPPDGKWFYHYDERRKILQIACPVCANEGKGQQCPHPKSEIYLFSDNGGWELLQGSRYILGHFDEHIGEEWYNESKMRLSGVKGSSLLVTGTPLFGDEAWEIRKLYNLWLEGAPRNKQHDGTDIVSVHKVSQFDAGLVEHNDIHRSMADMDEFEIQARIMGEPAPLAKNPVFDRNVIKDLMAAAKTPRVCRLDVDLPNGKHLQEIDKNSTFTLTNVPNGELAYYQIWEEPQPNVAYIIGVDTAKGLVGPNKSDPIGDASAASVLRLDPVGNDVKVSLVAQFYGWINPLDYSYEVFKLANYYSEAMVVIELTGGYGEAVMLKMRQELYYWNMFRDENNHAQADPSQSSRFGVETNARTKPYMVAALQKLLKDRVIDIPCRSTLREMLSFEQEHTEKNINGPRYRGVGGARDDRVMSLVIAASVIAQPAVVDMVMESAKMAANSTGARS
jgi:hypothetical protein